MEAVQDPPVQTAEEERYEEEFPPESEREGEYPEGGEPITDPEAQQATEEDDESGDGPAMSDGLTIRGDGQVSLDVGGATPDISVAKLKGKSIAIRGNLRKGDELVLSVSVRVGEVKFTDKIDADGIVVETKRTHVLEVESVDRRDLD